VRRRSLRRWAFPGLGAALVVAALATVVRRSETGRQLSRSLDGLDRQEQILRDRLTGERSRADSLEALPRIEDAAGRLGLRAAGDGEFFLVAESALDGEGAARSER
jgi:hypothetical protein